MSGPRIPGYEYVQHLGSGGFADVFLYEQQWPRQRVAVKVVRGDVALTEREKSLFTSEANAMARLADHPYIVSVITAGVTSEDQGSRPYLVMRYCPPPDLGVRVRSQPMSVPDALATGIKLASAIETAHRSGILHRDIKPSNVLVTTYQEPALTDFGIAGHMHEVHADSEVRISYPWSPPELLDGRSNGSVATDVYSLGATIWNLLTGRSPFAIPNGDNSSRALTARILHAQPPSLQRADAPAALDRLLQRCLAKNPAHRPQSALEVARELQRVESAAGYARTPIAVEGDRPVVTTPGPGPAGPDPEATTLKPASVEQPGRTHVRSSGPAAGPAAGGQTGTGAAEGPGADDVQEPGRGGLVWTVLGLAGLVAVAALVLGTTGGDGDDPGTDPSPTPTHTPEPVLPTEPLPEPRVEAQRRGGQAVFTFSVPGGTEKGDSWEWQADTGDGGRDPDGRVAVRGAGRVCVTVRLIRPPDTSSPTNKCLG